MTEPLVPKDVDLRDFAFMPLDVRRLLTSETWILGNGDERAAAMTLWLESWHQVPAGSLPNNDRMLAHLSQCPKWSRVREHALRGWEDGGDGRLYHPVVCEKALEAWIEKLSNSLSGASGNAKRWGVDVDLSGIREQFSTAVDMLRSIAPQSRALKKKIVATILSVSPPDSPRDSHGVSPPDSPPPSPPDRKGQGQGQGLVIHTPITPKGATPEVTPSAQKPERQGAIALKTWLAEVKAKGEYAIPEDDPVLTWARGAGIPDEFVSLAWAVFKARLLPTSKKYRDWRATFHNYVRGNYLKLWFVDGDGGHRLTTVGEQERRALQEHSRA